MRLTTAFNWHFSASISARSPLRDLPLYRTLPRPLHSRFPLRSGPYRLNEIEAICPGPKQRSAQRAGWCRVSMVFAHYKLWFQPDTGKEKL